MGCRAAFFYPLILLLCYPPARQHLGGVWHSPHQTKHKDLLLYCYSTVKASWLHPHSPRTYARRDGKVFPLRVRLEGHRESKRLCGIFIRRSNYYFFNSRWLSPLYFLITCWGVSQPPCLETGPLQTHFLVVGIPYFLSSVSPIYPISSLYEYKSLSLT